MAHPVVSPYPPTGFRLSHNLGSLENAMAKERKTKTLTYKHASFHVAGPNLKQLLGAALTKHETIGQRRESIGPADENPVWRLIGQYRIDAEFLLGVLMRYMPGTNPVVLIDDDTAKVLTVEQMKVPATADGKTRELLEGMLFFGAIDNHLVLMQSSGLRSDHLESHLQWLLHQAEVLEGTNTLLLVDQLPKTVRDRIAASEVRELNIGGALQAREQGPSSSEDVKGPTSPAGDDFHTHALALRDSDGSEGIFDAIKRFMAPDQAELLDLDALTGSNIEYVLKIKYRNNTTRNGQTLMNTLGAALRHAEGVETILRLKNGGQIRGEDLRLSGPVRITAYDGNANPDEVFEAMRKWLLDKLQSGELSA